MITETVHVNTENRPSVQNSVTVIIRAYGDEPVRLQAIHSSGRSVVVVGANPDQPVSFPAAWVYADDEITYGQLVSAYKDGDSGKLNALWRSARRFDGWK